MFHGLDHFFFDSENVHVVWPPPLKKNSTFLSFELRHELNVPVKAKKKGYWTMMRLKLWKLLEKESNVANLLL